MLHLLPILMIASAAALYHLSSKNLGGLTSNTWMALSLTYLISFLATSAIAFLAPGSAPFRAADFRTALPMATLLALACVGIEGGYLIAYRYGWNVTQLLPVTSLLSTVAVLSVGFFFFRESLPLTTLLGLTLVLAGVVLVHYR